jgi:hypothetical protein
MFGIAGAYLFALRLDPEMKNYANLYASKAKAGEGITERKIIFSGGSSCAHSIRPGDFIAEGIQCVNMGYHAGAGAPMLIAGGLLMAKPGDLVFLVVEPGLFTSDKPVSRVGLVGAIKLGQPSLANGSPFCSAKMSASDYVHPIRPGGIRLAKYVASLAPVFDLNQFMVVDEFGWVTDSRRIATPIKISEEYAGITQDHKQLLKNVKRYCYEHKIDIIYGLPWRLCKEEDVPRAKEWDAKFLAEMSAIIPVLHEDIAINLTDPDLFSDTYYHLNNTGAILRTSYYLKALKQGRVLHDGKIFDVNFLDGIKRE